MLASVAALLGAAPATDADKPLPPGGVEMLPAGPLARGEVRKLRYVKGLTEVIEVADAPGFEMVWSDWGWENKDPKVRRNRGEMLNWLESNGLTAQGAHLIWPGWTKLPTYLKQHEEDPAKLREEVAKHIEEICTTLGTRIDYWNVVNEPQSHDDLMEILDEPEMAEWFELHWKGNAPFFRRGWSPKPALKHYEDLVLGAWRTDVTTRTGDDGRATVRGHHGQYEVTVTHNGRTATRPATLDKGSGAVTVTVD